MSTAAAPSDFDLLLRDPSGAARHALAGPRPALSRTALLALVIGGAIYGGVLGSYRGELQVLYAAIKMPLVLLGALVVTAPAVWSLGVASGRTWTLRSVAALVLVAAGRASLVLIALAPLLWLAIDVGAGYHFSTLLATCAFAVAGLVALATLVRGLGASGALTALCAALVFLSALAQTGWALRPWLGRPSRPVEIVRVEPGVGPLESVFASTRLGMGDPSGMDTEGRSP